MKHYFKNPASLRRVRLALCVLMTLLSVQFARANKVSPVGATESSPKGSAPSSLASMPRLGLNTGDQMDAPALDNAGASGARMARVSVYWSSIEPTNSNPSDYDWAAMDSIFSRISSRGLQPFATLLSCPAWACVVGDGPLYTGMYTETAQFMGAMAARYSQPPYNVHYWEMWNEPDSAGGPNRQNNWGMHPAGYAQMLSYVYPAIKAADPDAVVVGGGLSYDFWFDQGGPFNPLFLPDMLDAGAASYMDALGFHYYTENAHGWTDISVKVNQMRGVMAAHGAPNLVLICTETGKTSSATYGGSDTIQSRYLVQMNAYAAKAGVRGTLWYLNRDFVAREPGWESFAQDGLTRLDNTRKPSFTAMQVLSREVGSGLYLRQVGAEEGVTGTLEGYRFAGVAPRQVSVVWNNASSAVTMTVPAAQVLNLLGAVDMYGQTVLVLPGANGTRTLSVGPDPVYLRWQTPRFSDVPFDAWMYPYVEYLASHSYISGYSDGTFRPGSSSTRGQFAKMTVLGMGWPINTTGGPHFRDVPTSQTYYSYVETAYNRGIIGGYNCGGSNEPCPGFYFRAMNDINRSQIAKIIVLAKGWTLVTPVTPTFSDVPPSNPFYSYIETAVSHTVVSGYADGAFRPGSMATRGQLSKMLALSLQQP